MLKVKITADATCDLTDDILKNLDITTIPLYVQMNGKMYRDGIDISAEEIFNHVREGGDIPGTSAPSIGDYTEFFTNAKGDADALVHISISSGISASHQSARLAADTLENVHVVDSKSLSSGTGLLVVKAAEMAKQGMGGEEIANALREMVDKVRASFIIDRLDFLRKGGRCSALQALGANLLKLKPCINLINGELKVGQKYKGSFAKSLDNYVDNELMANIDKLDTSRIFVTHSDMDDPQIVENVKNRIKSHAEFDEIIETVASSVISSHCGPNTLGILYMTK